MSTERDRDVRGRFYVTEAAVEQRREQVIKLRVDGYGFREIAKTLSIGLATAYDDFKAVMDRTTASANSTADEERRVSLERIDRAIVKLMPMLDDPDLALDAMDRLDKLERRRAALLGLDSPAKQELTGKDGAPLTVDARGALVERLAGLVAGSAASSAASSDPREPEPG